MKEIAIFLSLCQGNACISKKDLYLCTHKYLIYMKEKVDIKIQEIDNRVVENFRMLDVSGRNILGDKYALVMDASSIMRSHMFGVPNQAKEHRII